MHRPGNQVDMQRYLACACHRSRSPKHAQSAPYTLYPITYTPRPPTLNPRSRSPEHAQTFPHSTPIWPAQTSSAAAGLPAIAARSCGVVRVRARSTRSTAAASQPRLLRMNHTAGSMARACRGGQHIIACLFKSSEPTAHALLSTVCPTEQFFFFFFFFSGVLRTRQRGRHRGTAVIARQAREVAACACLQLQHHGFDGRDALPAGQVVQVYRGSMPLPPSLLVCGP